MDEITQAEISEKLNQNYNLICRLNSKEKNNFQYGINTIHERTKNADIEKRDKVSQFIAKLKNRILGRDKDEWCYYIHWFRL